MLLRAYLRIVLGLALVALLLDLGYRALLQPDEVEPPLWMTTAFSLIEDDLAQAGPAGQPAVLERLRATTGLSIELIDPADVARQVAAAGRVDVLEDHQGRQFYLFDSTRLGAIVRFGPVDLPPEPWLPRLLTPAFYLSIFVLVGLWLRPLLRDLDHIIGAAQRFAADYREPLDTARHTSRLTELATHLDEMSARIAALIRNQKELIAALSHEMRTPLARMRFALAVLDRSDRETLKSQVAALDRDVDEIEALIATMLNYARLDHPELRMLWQRTPVRAFIEASVHQAEASDVAFQVDVTPSFDMLNMDPKLMGLALSNLLGNAQRYARQRVRVAVKRHDDGVVMSVEDDGPGVPEAQREEIFRAFTRVDTSRSKTTGGAGLGLAIVARIAALHGGRAFVEASEALGGARFVVEWNAFMPRPARLDAPVAQV